MYEEAELAVKVRHVVDEESKRLNLRVRVVERGEGGLESHLRVG